MASGESGSSGSGRRGRRALIVSAFLFCAALPPACLAAFREDTTPALLGVTNCAAAWGDYDNDGDLDLALAGQDNAGTRVSRIYRNDGGGVFRDIGAPLVGVMLGALAWGDYDNDGDLDLALAGQDASSAGATRIYRNDGAGVFTDINAGIVGLFESALAWGDCDNDGDLDLAIAGRTSYG